jgi:hypothetical protein
MVRSFWGVERLPDNDKYYAAGLNRVGPWGFELKTQPSRIYLRIYMLYVTDEEAFVARYEDGDAPDHREAWTCEYFPVPGNAKSVRPGQAEFADWEEVFELAKRWASETLGEVAAQTEIAKLLQQAPAADNAATAFTEEEVSYLRDVLTYSFIPEIEAGVIAYAETTPIDTASEMAIIREMLEDLVSRARREDKRVWFRRASVVLWGLASSWLADPVHALNVVTDIVHRVAGGMKSLPW